jgi:hypothetical protein
MPSFSHDPLQCHHQSLSHYHRRPAWLITVNIVCYRTQCYCYCYSYLRPLLLLLLPLLLPPTGYNAVRGCGALTAPLTRSRCLFFPRYPPFQSPETKPVGCCTESSRLERRAACLVCLQVAGCLSKSPPSVKYLLLLHTSSTEWLVNRVFWRLSQDQKPTIAKSYVKAALPEVLR